MFQFDAVTETKLKQLAPEFQLKVRNWFCMCKVLLGIDMVVVSGVRTAAQQLALHKQDSRNPAPVAGKPDVHMLGIAVDVNGWKDGKPVLLKASPVEAWQPVADLAALFGLRWGHYFKGYDDRNHWDDK